MKKRIYIVYSLLIISFTPVLSQGELDLQPRILYRNEKSTALYLNSNGLGAGYRYGKRMNARQQYIYDIDFSIISHPKEVKISNSYDNTRSFVFGKQNNFFELRGVYGIQNEIFRKNDRGGVSVRYFYGGGPAIGILKPIYYEILQPTSVFYEFEIKREKFNPGIHDKSYIYGRAPFFKGIKEVSFVPGASVKAGFSFEYSRQDVSLHSLEAGISLDVYPKKIPIMATSSNNYLFFNLFVSYRFGKYIDISEAAMAESARRKEERKAKGLFFKRQKQPEQEEYLF